LFSRGEKLYVTQDKRRSLGGGKRKCCWGVITVVALAILVAVLAGEYAPLPYRNSFIV
jgi:hypothetical protein